MSIGTRLMCAILGVLVVGLAAMSYRTNELSRAALTRSILAQQSMAALGAAGAINVQLGSYVYAAKTAAADGVIAAVLKDPANAARVEDACASLTANRDNLPDVSVMGLINGAGLLVAGSGRNNVGRQNLGDREYFRDAMQGRTVISRASLSRTTGKPSAFVAAPVRVDGTVRGVVYMTVDLEAMSSRFLAGLKTGSRGYAFLSEPPGTTLAHPDARRIFENTSGFPWMRTMMQRKTGSMEYEFGGVERVAGFAEVPRTGWLVALSAEKSDVLSEVADIRNANIAAALAMLGVVALVVVLVVRGITRSLGKTVHFAERVAAGNLDENLVLDRRDELGVLARALQAMVEQLRGMIAATERKSREAEAAAEKAAEATREAQAARLAAESAKRRGQLEAAGTLEGIVERMASSAEALSSRIELASRGADVQRERAGETATAMEEMNATVMEVARNATEASHAAEETRAEAVRGEEVVESVAGAIGEVHAQAEQMGESLKVLGERADGIGRIMAVISDIADQTNLLALNAAIEAARAGEAGRGFAVVADEVRKLAEKTMIATREVGDAVGAIQSGTRQTVALMDDTAAAVERTNELADTAGAALKRIVTLVEGSTDQIRAIAAASEEQSAASGQINRGTEEINRIASETAGTTRQSARAVAELTEMAKELSRLVDQLKNG